MTRETRDAAANPAASGGGSARPPAPIPRAAPEDMDTLARHFPEPHVDILDTLILLWPRLTLAQRDSILNVIESCAAINDELRQVSGDSNAVRACRVCGCTDDRACVDTDGTPCHWVERDLCSACVAHVEGDARVASE